MRPFSGWMQQISIPGGLRRVGFVAILNIKDAHYFLCKRKAEEKLCSWINFSMAEIITRNSGWTARIFWPKMWN